MCRGARSPGVSFGCRDHLLSHGAGRAAQPEHCVLYERWILVTQRESLSQSRESKSSRALLASIYGSRSALHGFTTPYTVLFLLPALFGSLVYSRDS